MANVEVLRRLRHEGGATENGLQVPPGIESVDIPVTSLLHKRAIVLRTPTGHGPNAMVLQPRLGANALDIGRIARPTIAL